MNTTMNTSTVRRSMMLSAACLATLIGSVAVSAAPASKALDMLNSRAAVANTELPSHAREGSGMSGALSAGVLAAPALDLMLADGREITVRLQRMTRDDKKGTQSWVGTVDGQPGSILVLSKVKGVITGFATFGSETWELAPGKAGLHVLFRVDESKMPSAEPVLHTDTSNDAAASSDFGTGGASVDAAGGYVHDLLIVYTPAARTKYGQAALESMIQNAVVAANQAYLNSKIGITLNLVGLQEVAYTETGTMKTSLFDLQGSSDGKMDGVHQLRNSIGADLVTLISEDTSSCGIAWVMTNESTGFASNAFNVVKSSCLSQHSLAHELGHNQGNEHDRANAVGYYGSYPYSYGFKRCVTDGTGFRTVMSYSCSGANRVAWFSSPNASYNGYPTGIAYEMDPANSADNARSMNNTADTVAAFRTSPGSGISPSVPAAPSSLSASATAYNSVTARWADNSSDEAGFKLERSGNGVDFVEVATLGAGAASFADSGVTARSTYYYRVRAYSSAGNSGYSNIGSVTTPDVPLPPPAAPTAVVASDNADGSAAVSWVDAATNETGFEVYRESWDAKRKVWKSSTAVANVPTGVTSIVDVTGNGTFRYSVSAMNSGGKSAYAGPAATIVTGAPTKGGARGK